MKLLFLVLAIDLFGMFMQEKLVANNYYLNKSAKDAYRSYILAYNSHSMKDIFNVHRLDMQVPYTYFSLFPLQQKKDVLLWVAFP